MNIVNPLSIVSVGRCKYALQSPLDQHCHNYFQLFFFTSGQGIFQVKGKEYRVKENDLFLISPGTYHGVCAESSRQPLRSMEVKFHAFDKDLTEYLQTIPTQSSCDQLTIKITLQNMIDEAVNQALHYKDVIASTMMVLLLQLVRMNHKKPTAPNDPSSIIENKESDISGQILDYIHLHYTEHLNLHDLADMFNINHAYLCQMFSEKYGVSPIQYINKLKLQRVKELLSNSDHTVTEISELVGFSSIHYMSRYFAIKENMSPLEFRRRASNHFHISVQDYMNVFPRTIVQYSNPLD
ncbi:MAG: hypothetical protein K0Q59_4147 [Paenibacillus sp.]|jgi:YesN/AraC family two-component response regulator|nr:hypothetical protein [Paenibacillus sp.]